MTQTKTIKGMAWHEFHNRLLTYCFDYNARVEEIKREKPKNEQPTRLRLFKITEGKLPDEVIEACQKYGEAWQKLDEVEQDDEAWQKYDEARQKYKEVLKKHKQEIIELHKKECKDCVWDYEREEMVFD